MSHCRRIDKARCFGRWRWRASICHYLNTPSQELEVRVALIRDWRRLIPKVSSSEEEDRPRLWDEQPDGTHEYWLDENWQATPLPAPPMEPKLIHIVTTEAVADAVELVQTYTRRWPAQENVIRDWLIPRCLR